MYEDGDGGLPRDLVQAYKWFLLSAGQEDAGGRHDLMEMDWHHALTPEQTAEAKQLAAEFRTNGPAVNSN